VQALKTQKHAKIPMISSTRTVPLERAHTSPLLVLLIMMVVAPETKLVGTGCSWIGAGGGVVDDARLAPDPPERPLRIYIQRGSEKTIFQRTILEPITLCLLVFVGLCCL
jgi:hypothetical protein